MEDEPGFPSHLPDITLPEPGAEPTPSPLVPLAFGVGEVFGGALEAGFGAVEAAFDPSEGSAHMAVGGAIAASGYDTLTDMSDRLVTQGMADEVFHHPEPEEPPHDR